MKRLLSLVVCLLFFSTSPAIATPKICIDPGHGGSDSGATVGGGVSMEKTYNLDTARKLRNWLNRDTKDSGGGSSWNVIMTRTTDATVSLAARTSYANSNGANRFISIHHNAFSDASANGVEAFIYPNVGSTTVDLGTKIYEELRSHSGLKARGLKRENFHVLRETAMSAVLTEDGFMTNSGDVGKIRQESWRNKVAQGFMHGLQRHYGKSAYNPK